MILIDTNIFVDFLRAHPSAIKFFNGLTDSDDVSFSAITETELLVGNECNSAEKRETLLHFLHSWNKIEVTNPIAVLAGDLSRTNNISIPDAIIAASALLNNAELQTKNIKDFQKIKALKVCAPY